ncbi:BMP family ABC transporter substrate-binding protein [Chloroflexota bacterium]
MNTRKPNRPRIIYRIVRLGGVMILAFTAVLLLMLGLQTQQAAAVGYTVGLIPDESGVNDNGWNETAYQGLLRAESELPVIGTVYTPTDGSDYGPQLQQCVDDGNDLCITTAFWLNDATLNAANNNPGTKFAILDTKYDNYPANLRGMTFHAKQAGYLAGVLAGLMTESDVIGAVAGLEIEPVVVWTEGYRNGAQCANPAVKVLIEYNNTWIDPDLGAQVAQDMMAQGADAIFGVGGQTGNGGVLTATQSGAWGIGVDVDYYPLLFGSGTVDGSDKLLSSALKKFDNAVFDTISDVVTGTFTSGEVVYTLTEDGVGLAPFHEADPFVSQSVRDALENTKQGIISGTINIDETCRSYIYLPLIFNDWDPRYAVMPQLISPADDSVVGSDVKLVFKADYDADITDWIELELNQNPDFSGTSVSMFHQPADMLWESEIDEVGLGAGKWYWRTNIWFDGPGWPDLPPDDYTQGSYSEVWSFTLEP